MPSQFLGEGVVAGRGGEGFPVCGPPRVAVSVIGSERDSFPLLSCIEFSDCTALPERALHEVQGGTHPSFCLFV